MTNIELIANSPKIKTIADILKNIDLITDVLKEDAMRIIKRKGGFTDNDWEQYYAEAAKWTKKQLNKHHLKFYQRIFKCGDIKAALRLLLVRIIANVKNQFDKNRKGTVAYWSAKTKETVKQNIIKKMNANDPLEILLDQEMQILAEEAQQKNLEEYKEELKQITRIEKVGNHFQLAFNYVEMEMA